MKERIASAPSLRRPPRRPFRLFHLLGILALATAGFYLLSQSLTFAAIASSSLSYTYSYSSNAPPLTDNIALAYAHNVSAHRLTIFVLSWATYSPATKLVLFTSPDLMKQTNIMDLYEQAGVEAVEFTPPSFVDDPLDPEEEVKPGRLQLGALQHYVTYLDHHMDEDVDSGVAILGAVQDVVLQSDPFTNAIVQAAVLDGTVLVSEEGGAQLGAIVLEDHAPTLRALNECYGPPGISALGRRRLVSADVVFARRGAALHYTRLLSDILGTRVRFKCLRNPRPDVVALSHVLYEVAEDPLNLDFRFTVAGYKDPGAPVLGAALGLPVVLSGRGVILRPKMNSSRVEVDDEDIALHANAPLPGEEEEAAALEQVDVAAEQEDDDADDAPAFTTPAVVSRYDAHPLLLKSLLALYQPAALDIEFLQSSGYTGRGLVDPSNTSNDDVKNGGDDGGVLLLPLPESWEKAAMQEVSAAATSGKTVGVDEVVEEMAKRRAAAVAEVRRWQEKEKNAAAAALNNDDDSERDKSRKKASKSSSSEVDVSKKRKKVKTSSRPLLSV